MRQQIAFYASTPSYRPVLAHHGCFSVDRDGADMQALRRAVDILTEGRNPLVIFPEGARSTSSGSLDRFKAGAVRLALEAQSLGFDSLVAIDTPAGSFDGVDVLSGIILQDAPMREVIARVKRAKDSGAVVSVMARDNGFNRAAIGLKGVHVLRGIQAADKTAFDHVTAKMAADNNVAIDIDLSVLISDRGIARQRAIHRYRDVLIFERRFEFPVTLSSHARSYLDLRAVREITGLCSLIGMETSDVEKALDSVGRVTTPQPPAVRVVS